MRLPLLAGLTAAALLAFGCRQPLAAPPDVIYTGAKILTLDAASSVAEAVAVRGGRFVAVGSNGAIERLAARDTRRVDLGGMTVLPGFVDGHAHPSLAVRMIEKYVDVRIATGRASLFVCNSAWRAWAEARLRTARSVRLGFDRTCSPRRLLASLRSPRSPATRGAGSAAVGRSSRGSESSARS